MKAPAAQARAPRRHALRASVALNLFLTAAVALLLLRRTPPETVALPVAAPPATLSAQPDRNRDLPRPAAAGRAANAPDSEGLDPALVARLREVGLPRTLLADVVLQDFHRRWEARGAALEKKYAPKPVPEREYRELSRRRETEQVRELTAALGEEGYATWDKERTLAHLNVGGIELTAEEAERAYRLQKDFEEKHRELQIAMEDGVADPADAAALQERARQAFERETEQLLGRERHERMRGGTTPVADAAWRFAALNPTPEQATAAARVEQAYRDQEAALTGRLGQSAGNPAALAAELRGISAARDAELRRLFGAENFDALQRQNDPTYQALQQYAGAWELRDHEVGSVYASLRTFQEEAGRLRNAAALAEAAGQTVNWPDIDRAIDQSRQQAEAGLQRLIGPERLRRLRQNGLLSPR